MSLWVIDTDSFSLFQRKNLLITQRINAVPAEDIAITIVTAEEQMYGRLNRIRRANSPEDLVLAYTQLRSTLEDLKTINILNFGQDAANIYTQLVRERIRIGTQDLRIAAITISNSGILVTRNQRDFSRVPGLRFEDWTIDESLT